MEYYLIAIPIDLFSLWIGIKGVKVLYYAMKTGRLTKEGKKYESDAEEFDERIFNAILIFMGALFFFPCSVLLTVMIIFNLIMN